MGKRRKAHIRAREFLTLPLPDLVKSINHTGSSSLGSLRFEGSMQEWPEYSTDTRNTLKEQRWSNRTVCRTGNGGRYNSPERIPISDEKSPGGRFHHQMEHALGAALDAQTIRIQYASFRSANITYSLDPDVALIDDSVNLKAVGELKVPRVAVHQMTDDMTDDARRLLFAQPLRYMHHTIGQSIDIFILKDPCEETSGRRKLEKTQELSEQNTS